MARLMADDGVTLEDMLDALDQEREAYYVVSPHKSAAACCAGRFPAKLQHICHNCPTVI
jgi:hypothetical protein